MIFDWDRHGWMMWVSKEKGALRLIQMLAQTRYYSSDPGELYSGQDPFVMHNWPELHCYRDIVFYWKYFCCTDRRVFPVKITLFSLLGMLEWQCAPEAKVFGTLPNRGLVFCVSGLGKKHLLLTGMSPGGDGPDFRSANVNPCPTHATPMAHPCLGFCMKTRIATNGELESGAPLRSHPPILFWSFTAPQKKNYTTFLQKKLAFFFIRRIFLYDLHD